MNFGRLDGAASLRDLHLARFRQPLGRPAGWFHQVAPAVVIALVYSARGFRGADGGGRAAMFQEVADSLFQAPVDLLLVSGHLASMTSRPRTNLARVACGSH